jgi:hypothetical protein
MTFFYNLNKKLNSIESAPESQQLNERDMGKHNNATTGFKALAKKAGGGEKGERIAGAQFQKMKKAGQIEEEGMSRAAKGYEKYGKEGMEALAKAGREGKSLDPVRKKYDKYDEGAYQAGPDKSQIPAVNRPGNKVTLQDLEKERTQSPTSPEGLKRAQQRLSQQHPIGEKMNPAKAKKFAALAEPKDKITFADKIAGAKKEVDEMLGDVAAEAMKNALSGGQKKLDKNNNGKLDANDFAMLRKGGKKVADESRDDEDDVYSYQDPSKKKTHKTASGGTVTRHGGVTRHQAAPGHYGGYDPETDPDKDDDKAEKPAGEKRGRGRPKGPAKGPERVTAKATKHKGGRKVAKEGDFGPMEEDTGELKAAMTLLKKAGYKVSKDGAEELDEKAVSKKQQKFMGMVHATQKGEKAPSKEVAKVAKTMKKSDAEDFASTKHKGLPEKAPKKKEKTEEAGGTDTPTASSGFSYGKGIYDSLNRDLENAISESMERLNESMSINMSDSTEGGKSLTITATDEDALKLATLLKSAGLGGGEAHGHDEGCSSCGQSPCGCEDEAEIEIDEVSMNEPDYPTDTETSDDALQYAGGLNKPKSTGQSTVPVLASQDDRQHSYAEAEEDAIKRMMEMAGIKEGKKPDFLDIDKDGDKEEPMKKAVDDKKEKKVDEGILASTRALWKKYQG